MPSTLEFPMSLRPCATLERKWICSSSLATPLPRKKVKQMTSMSLDGSGIYPGKLRERFRLSATRSRAEPLGMPLVVATADSVLGLMANARKPVLSFPAIVQSAIVFDEVHAYDETLFGHLLIFLETFPRIPVLDDGLASRGCRSADRGHSARSRAGFWASRP